VSVMFACQNDSSVHWLSHRTTLQWPINQTPCIRQHEHDERQLRLTAQIYHCCQPIICNANRRPMLLSLVSRRWLLKMPCLSCLTYAGAVRLLPTPKVIWRGVWLSMPSVMVSTWWNKLNGPSFHFACNN